MANHAVNVELGQLLKHTVRSKKGEILGRIDDFIINVREGRIEYIKLLIQSDGESFERIIAIPWSQFKLDRTNDGIELDISSRVLKLVAANR